MVIFIIIVMITISLLLLSHIQRAGRITLTRLHIVGSPIPWICRSPLLGCANRHTAYARYLCLLPLFVPVPFWGPCLSRTEILNFSFSFFEFLFIGRLRF